MAFVTITCPQCGGQALIEAGRSVMCPYCGKEISAPAADGGFAYAPVDAQQSAVQFAPPPVQTDMQDPTVFGNQPAVMPAQPYQQQYVMPQYTQEQLLAAQQKRTNWYYTNAAMIGGQTLLFAFGVFYAILGFNVGAALILTWVLSIPGCGLLSALLRPDDAYIDKKPMFKSKIAHGFAQLILGAATSSAVGAIIGAILNALFG
ncbi:MAG: zinc ribbon domain-containing protein [Oscillospiraceae bacterium]|nr:zinc ribbon domain-containing protein [Oscillospiraceae bacterium]MBR3447643.1 zinc ribbon domain-containing protein [Oscillospiraceae bacterium]